MTKRVAFQASVPVTIALAYRNGIQVDGRYGDQVMYTGEHVVYVPRVVRSRMVELGVGKADFVTHARRNGAKERAGLSSEIGRAHV